MFSGTSWAPGKSVARDLAWAASAAPYSMRVTVWSWVRAVAVPATVKWSAVSLAAALPARPSVVVPL